MNIESFRDYCLSLPRVTEDFPFGPATIVFKVNGKMFALTNIDLFESFNVKCDPEKAIELRETFDSVIPGYHMNKKHWNTVMIDHKIPDKTLKEWVRESYDLVAGKKVSKR